MEKILEILNRYADASNIFGFGIVIHEAQFNSLAKEIHELYMEFAEWCVMDFSEYFEAGTDIYGDNEYFDMDGNQVTFSDIFNYWLTEIKGK